MIRSAFLTLLILILDHYPVHALYSQIIKRIVVDDLDFQCIFDLSYSETEVDLLESFVTCDAYENYYYYDTETIENIEVVLSAPNGFEFSGVITIYPTEIVSLVIDNAITEPPPDSTESDAGAEEMEFKEIYNNASAEELPDYRHECGVDPILEEIEIAERRNRSYTSTDPVTFWTDAVVPWSFISNGDGFSKYAVYTDANIGLPEAEVKTVIAAMKQISAATCIKFNMVKPKIGQKNWLLVSREARFSDKYCMINYIKSNYVGKNMGGYGNMLKKAKDRTYCFSGAYAYYGMDSPQNFVISQTKVDDGSQGSIGLVVHELLHNLAFGHTQKRQDALEHITVNWNNIDKDYHRQYKQCFENEDETCDFYNDYDTPYDCMSIMHYRDWGPLGKTMRAKRSSCDLSSPNSRLTAADKDILNKMYCSKKPGNQENVVMSPNYPSNYPDNQDKTYPVTVAAGKVIKLKFTDFRIEAHSSCIYDWVEIIDNDGTKLLEKSCGMTKPKEIISKTNKLNVIFHSDHNTNHKGFRAEYEAVRKYQYQIFSDKLSF